MAGDNKTTSSAKSHAYDQDFENMLIAANIMRRGTTDPANLQHLLTVLSTERGDVDNIDKDKYINFCDAVARSRTESEVWSNVYSVIRGDLGQAYQTSNETFTRTKLFAKGMRIPKPDHFDGIEIESDYTALREKLAGLIVPTRGSKFLPNFFGEIKGGEGDFTPVVRQAAYDGAFGARGMLYTANLLGPRAEEFNNKAYTFSATWSSEQLQLFAHWPTQPRGPNTTLKYNIYRLEVWNLTRNPDELRVAIRAYRNLREHAHDVREKLARKARDVLAVDPNVQVKNYPEVQSLVNMAGAKVRKTSSQGSRSRQGSTRSALEGNARVQKAPRSPSEGVRRSNRSKSKRGQ